MLRRFVSSLVVLLFAVALQAAPFTAGNIVVYRVGDGVAALNGSGTAVFLDEYTTAGVFVQSVAMPNTVAGSRLVAAGTATTEGFLSRSQDGQYLIVPGYDAAVGAATPNSSTTIPRVMGRVDSAATIDLTSSYIDSSGAGNIRSATSLDGTRFWASGSTQGIRTVALGGSGAATIVSTTNTNTRQIHIFNNQLYIGAGAGAVRLGAVGTGTPITTGNTMTSLPGFPTAAPTAVNGYLFADLDAGVAGVDTVYVADEGNNVISKWCLVAGTWTARGTTALATARGLAGTVSGSTVTLFAVGGGAGTPIVTITDSTGYNVNLSGSVTTIVASAGTNKAFRGLAMAPVTATPAPAVQSIVRANSNPTNSVSVDFTVTFTQSVTGVDMTDFTLTNTGGIAGASVTGVTGSGSGPYTVSVNTGTGSGTIRLDVTDDDSIINGTSIPLGGAGAGNGNFITGEVYTIDKTGPAVQSSTRADSNPTNAASVNFTVSFGETVTGLDMTDFALTNTGGIAGASVTGVTGTGPYMVSVNTGTGDGTIRLDFVDNDSVTDALGNTTAAGFTAGEFYTIDKTGPTVQSVTRVNASPTSAASVDFLVSFGETVSGVDNTDFTLTTTGAVAGASVTGVTGTGPYTVSVNTGTGSGTIRLDVVDDDTILDTLGNPLTGAFTTGEVYTIDKSAPSVVSINRVDTNPTNAADVDFQVIFDVAVTGVDATDFALALSGVTGTINTPTGAGTTWNVNVSGVTGDGTLGLNLVDDDSIINGTSIPLGGAGAGNGNFTGQVYDVDHTPPAVQSSVRANANPTNATSRDFTVTFTETVSGVDMTDFTLTTTGGIAGASVTGVTGTGPYTVSVNTGTGDGTIRLDFVDNDSVTDTAGNPTATGFTAGEFYTIDKTAPSVQSIVRASTNPTAGPTVDYTVTFSEDVTGVNTGDFTIFTTGAISGTSVTLVAGGPMIYTVTVNTGSDSGTLRLDVVDDDSVADLATNPLGGTGAGNGNFNSGEVYTVNAPTPAPTGLVGVVSPGKVALAWNTVPSATSYTVKRATISGGPYSTIGTPATNSLDDTIVVNGTRYYYVVTATGPSGESANSSEVHAKPDVAEALGIDISQVYGNGGNAGSVFTTDFIELFNRGNSTVDLSGWSVQYASAAGTSWTPTNLTGTLAPGRHYLIAEAAGAGGTTPLPTPEASGAIAMSGTAGKVALVASTTPLSGGCPPFGGNVLDFVGYGATASCFEGAGPTANATGANAQQRASNGCVDTNNNAGDFATGGANPRNTASAATPCTLTAIGIATPNALPSGNSTLFKVELPPATTGGAVTGNLSSIGGSASQTFFDDGSNGDVTMNDNIFSFQSTATGAAGVKSIPVSATNLAAQSAATTIVFTLTPPLETIAAVKVDTTPADTVPDRNGQAVLTQGVVTSIDFRGGTGIEYYIQDATGGIDVFSTSDFGPFTVGASVQVSGTVTQFNGLTEISPTSMVVTAALPAITPQVVTLSAINESLEGQLVRVNNLTIAPGAFAADTNYAISDGSPGTLRVDGDTDIDGTNAPTTTFSLIGVVGQFDNSNPFDSGYQIIPRSTADIIPLTAPTGVGGANPPSVPPGGVSLLTVNVTPGQNPPSTGITVVANLSTIGLSASQAFLDDGATNGDVAAGDGIYSYSATVNGATPLGPKSLPVVIADAQARSSNATINLNIQSASAPPTPVNLAATPGNAQIGLTWDPSAGATGYNVKRSTVSGGPYSTIAPNHPTNNYTDSSVTNGVTYYYVVSALNGVDESGDSNQVSATPTPPPPAGPLAKIYFVDIGQGAGTLIVSPTGQSLLIDAGPNGAGTGKVLPLLNTVLPPGDKIDYTIVTHYHVDHDAGMTEVINAGRLDGGIAYDNGDAAHVIPPVPSNSTGTAFTAYKNAITSRGGAVTRTTITPGLVINLGGGMTATCLVTGGSLASGGNVYVSGTDLNSSSISTLIQYNNFDYLVSGDLTGGGQTTTAKTPDVETFVAQMAGDVDFVQLDHHGSTTANNRRFLGMLKAEGSLASIGTSNTFGHPNRETVNRYLNIPVTNGNTYGGETVPTPGNGPVHYQTEASPPTDNRTSVQFYSGSSPADAGEGTVLLTTDGTVSYTMESFDDGGVRISPLAHVYPIDGQGLGLATNFPPTVIPNLTPAVPTAADVVTVTALVNDVDPITSVTLNYSINGAAQAPVTMTPTVGNEFAATIPAQPNGTRIDYTVTAVAAGQSTSYSGGYFAGTTTIATLRSLTALFEPTFLDYTARISGLVTSGTGNYSTTNNDDYIDDGTGALNISRTIEPDTPATQPTTTGNTYTVTGFINQLTGKFRLDVTPPFDGIDKPWASAPGSFNPFSITVTGSGAVTPVARTIAQILGDAEGNEAKLVTISNCTVVSGTIPASGTLDGFLVIDDGTGTMEMKIDGDSDIIGMATPAGTFNVIGIVQQDDFLRPFNARYTIAPRDRTDLGGSGGGPALITIAEARVDEDPTTFESPDDFIPDRLGQQVKIRGVVTSVDFRGAAGTEIYIQDPTGGIDIFSTTINTVFNIGDNLEVVGTVAQFNGLTEITPSGASDITLLAPGTLPAVTPQVVTVSQLANAGVGEPFEGRLIRINNVTLASPPATFGANVNYNISDVSGGPVQMRIDSDTDIDGTVPPASPFSVIGVLGQFDNSNPFDSGYQLFPLSTASFLPAVATPNAIAATAGTPQSANINTAFATLLQATVTDAGSAPIEGIGVTFTAPAAGASGLFANNTNSTSAVTNASGIATATLFTANAVPGSYIVTATTGALSANFNLTNNDPSATHFDVTVPANVTAGTPFNITVTARDASNAVATGYAGTVHFTSTSAGTLPADYTYVGGDNGVHVFSVTLTQAGARSITATDTGNASITGTGNLTVDPSADLSVTKVDTPDPVFTGNNITYTITVTNGGPSDATNATLADTVPTNTTFVSLSSPGGWNCTVPSVGGTGNINCSIPTMTVGNAVFTLVVDVDNAVTTGTIITNTVTVGSSTTDPTNNQTASATTTVSNQSSDLSVTKSDSPDPVNAGSNITYTITVNNAGPDAAINATLADTLPANTTFVSLSSPGGWSCATPAVGGTGLVNCSIPSLAVSAPAVFTLVVNVDTDAGAGSTISNTATVASDSADPSQPNNTITADTAVLSPATVTATKTATGTFQPGTNVTYTITLSNSGPADQNDLPADDEFTDILPSQLTLISANASSGTATANVGTNTVTWNGSIPAGGSVTVTILALVEANVPVGSSITNQGTVRFNADGSAANGNEASAPTDDPAAGGSGNATTFVVAAPASIADIPALDPRGLVALAALLAAVGILIARRS
jgi:uncharacterized repeat protein (TIGR01451 family)